MEMNGHVPNGDTAHNHFQPILHEVEETLSHLPELLYSKADSSESEDDEELSASDASVPEAEDEDDAVPPQSDDEEDNEAHLLAPGLSSPMDEHVSQSGWARSEEPHWRPAEFPEASGWVVLGTMLSYTFLFMFGYLRDFLRYIGWEKVVGAKDLDKHKDFVPLLSDFENFYIVNVVRRTYDCWKRPICAVPGATTTCMERVTYDGGFTYKMTGRTSTILNLSSYNYLGFAQNTGPCAVATKEAIRRDGIATCSHRQDLGNAVIHRELETLVAEFLGAEDAVCYPMGYATNSMNMPAIAGKGCLLLSDELNHSSLITGIKLSGATKRIFKHNDMEDLERKLRDAIIMGQPRTRRPFKKIIVIVEGVYSMEGTIVNLPAVIALKKKYKAYLYLDEAHSVGAMGPHGRGVVDYWGCDPRDVDILMGTFTKSFGSVGGYIAGSKVLSAMGIIKGQDGTTDGQDRIRRLRRNSIYFRRQLKARGFIVYGHDDSPVIPLLLYSFPMVSAFSRDMLARFGMATVTVAFPATPIYLGRARFCVSSAHTQRMIDLAVEAIDELGDEMGLKFLGARDTLPAIPY